MFLWSTDVFTKNSNIVSRMHYIYLRKQHNLCIFEIPCLNPGAGWFYYYYYFK